MHSRIRRKTASWWILDREVWEILISCRSLYPKHGIEVQRCPRKSACTVYRVIMAPYQPQHGWHPILLRGVRSSPDRNLWSEWVIAFMWSRVPVWNIRFFPLYHGNLRRFRRKILFVRVLSGGWEESYQDRKPNSLSTVAVQDVLETSWRSRWGRRWTMSLCWWVAQCPSYRTYLIYPGGKRFEKYVLSFVSLTQKCLQEPVDEIEVELNATIDINHYDSSLDLISVSSPLCHRNLTLQKLLGNQNSMEWGWSFESVRSPK